MNPASLDEAENLFANLQAAYVKNPQAFLVVCPPVVYLKQLIDSKDSSQTHFLLGAQDLSIVESGALTGEISGPMLQNLGAEFVIIGHSETRKLHTLSNEAVNQKVNQALANSLTPILCVGYEREPGSDKINYNELGEQVKVGLNGIQLSSEQKIYLAYEPVWAIGTGKTASNEVIKTVNQFIIQQLEEVSFRDQVEILYGGSVDDQNLSELSEIESVSGFLIGGASLKPEKFTRMIEQV